MQALALTLQWLVGGLVVIEVLFAYPGIGEGLVQAVTARDMPADPVRRASIIALFYIIVNVVADLLIVLLIPKLRTAQ